MRHHRAAQPLRQWRDVPSPRREDGIEGLEMALIGALIVVIILMGVPLLDTGITNAIENVTNAMLNPDAQ